jgi:hypothetical protein
METGPGGQPKRVAPGLAARVRVAHRRAGTDARFTREACPRRGGLEGPDVLLWRPPNPRDHRPGRLRSVPGGRVAHGAQRGRSPSLSGDSPSYPRSTRTDSRDGDRRHVAILSSW